MRTVVPNAKSLLHLSVASPPKSPGGDRFRHTMGILTLVGIDTGPRDSTRNMRFLFSKKESGFGATTSQYSLWGTPRFQVLARLMYLPVDVSAARCINIKMYQKQRVPQVSPLRPWIPLTQIATSQNHTVRYIEPVA